MTSDAAATGEPTAGGAAGSAATASGSTGSSVADEYEALIQFLYLAPVGIAQTAIDGEIVLVNPICAQLLMPLSRDGTLANLFEALQDVAPDLRTMVAAFALPHGMVCDAVRIPLDARTGAAGRSEVQTLSLSLLKLDDTRLMAVLTDITAAVKRERLLEQNQAWFNAIMTGITDYALIGLDAHGCVTDWNASIGRVTGFQREQVLHQPCSMFDLEGASARESMIERLHEADRDGWSLDDGWRRRADGTRFWASAIIAPLRAREHAGDWHASGAAGDHGYSLIIRDITDKRDAGRSLRHALLRDHLTGVANRRAFFDAAEREVARCRRTSQSLSLILLDADRFKSINDRFGHAAGDAVLRSLANDLTGTFGDTDLVARLGGEEFVVLLPRARLPDAAAWADRLREQVASQTVVFEEQRIGYTVSCGVAALGDDVADLNALIRQADRALYAAKAAGRDRVECRPDNASSQPVPAAAGVRAR